MYLIVPSGMMKSMYNGFAKGIYTGKQWTSIGSGYWVFKYKWEDAQFIMHIHNSLGVKKCTLKIERGDSKFNFDVISMELQELLDESNKPKYASDLTFNVKDIESGQTGEMFLTVYPLEEKIYEMNKRLKR